MDAFEQQPFEQQQRNGNENLRRMRALDDQWKSGAKVECPEDLSHYLKGIVLNDYAIEETNWKVKILCTESAIEMVRERLSNVPEEEGEAEFLKLRLEYLTRELDWYRQNGGEPMDPLAYEMFLLWGAKLYGWK